MALNRKNMAHMGYGNGQNQWSYRTPDARASVIASGYFNDMASDLVKGDTIDTRTSVGGTELMDILRVTSETGATPVTVGATALT